MKLVPLFNVLLMSFCCTVFSFSYANDTAVGEQGENLYPIKSTDLELQKEVLTFHLGEPNKENGKDTEVYVYFEVFNHGPERDEVIGFVTPPFPPADYPGDTVPRSIDSDLSLSGTFDVLVNGEWVNYQIKKLPHSEFKHPPGTREDDNGYRQDYDYLYYFTAHLKPGLNTLVHHYTFIPTIDVMGIHWKYRWTTIHNWKQSKVRDFSVKIYGNPGYLYAVPQQFWKNTKEAILWKTNGDISALVKNGKEKQTEWEGYFANDTTNTNAVTFYRFNKGDKNSFLTFSQQNFAPDYDFTLSGTKLPGPYITLGYPIEKEYEKWSAVTEAELKNLPKEKRDLLRNYLFARCGYDFSDPKLKAFFSQYLWYYPESKNVSEWLSDEDKAFLGRLKNAE